MTAGRWLAGWPAGWLACWHAESADWPIGWLLTLRSARFLLLASVFLVARCSLLAALLLASGTWLNSQLNSTSVLKLSLLVNC